MRAESASSSKQGRDNRSPGRLRIVLLALAGVVAGLTIYVAVSESIQPLRPQATAPKATLADEVLSRSESLLAAAQYTQAKDLLLAYTRSNPADTDVRWLLARAYVKLGRADRAEKIVDEVLSLSPRSGKALWLKGELIRRRGGEKHMYFFRQAARSPIDSGPQIWTAFAMELLGANKHKSAEEYFRKSLAAGAKDFRVFAGLGELAMMSDRFAEAEEFLSRALEYDRKSPRAWAMLAEAQKNAGKLDEAARTIDQGLKIRRNGLLLMARGEVQLLQQRRQEAAEAFAAAADYRAVRPLAAFKAARCYYLLGGYAKAMKYIDLALSLVPDDAAVLAWKKKIEDARFGPTKPRELQTLRLTPGR